MSVPCLAVCVGRAELTVSLKVARALGLRDRLLASATTVLRSPARLTFALKLDRRLRARVRSVSALPVTVTIAVGRSTIRQTLTLTR